MNPGLSAWWRAVCLNRALDAAEAMAGMDMQNMVRGLRTSPGESLCVRIGIDVGPVVAGVIERKRSPMTCGGTVNPASRMEPHGISGQIQVTLHVHERLRHRYRFQPREPVEVKGKGRIVPYLLLGDDEDAPTRRGGARDDPRYELIRRTAKT